MGARCGAGRAGGAGLVDLVGESANVAIRTHDRARFIASLECQQALRVTSREGMAFPAHRVTGGLVLLAELSDDEVQAIYEAPTPDTGEREAPDMPRLLADLARIRVRGLALNQGRSEKGVVAVGRIIRDRQGRGIAGLSVSIPSVRYTAHDLPRLDAAPRFASSAITAALPRSWQT